MAYHRCVYHKCDNRSTHISMFRFPTHDQARLEVWIRNSGNNNLSSLTNEKLRLRFICADHFPTSEICKGILKSRLVGPAVPYHFESEEAREGTNNVCNKKTAVNVINGARCFKDCKQCADEVARGSSTDFNTKNNIEELKNQQMHARTYPSSRIQKEKMRNRLLGPVPMHFESKEARDGTSITISMDKEKADVKNEKISVCRICLRSDVAMAESIDKKLSDLYDKLTDVNVFVHTMLSFCPLCEYKLKKFYNFKQRCLRSKYVLQNKLSDMSLESLAHLIPEDLGFSTSNDRRGLFDYKCNFYTADVNSMETDEPQTDIFESNEKEVMIVSDFIKTEVEDPIEVEVETIESDASIKVETIENYVSVEVEAIGSDASVKVETIENYVSVEVEAIGSDASVKVETIENDASVEVETIESDASVKVETMGSKTSQFNNLDDFDSKDYEYNEAYLVDCEMPISKSKNKTTEKNLSCKTKTLTKDAVRTEKFTKDQLKSLRKESFDRPPFLSAASLFAHRRDHIGDRRFECEICFKGFLHSYTLKEHVNRVHNQIRRVRTEGAAERQKHALRSACES